LLISGEKVLPLLRPCPKKVSVFSSFARSKDTPESDIDLFVELKPPELSPHLGFKWFGICGVEGILGRKVDLAT
jgi:predicted nucleotidyltransferase